MKIEVDTKHDSKEELAALATMLHTLSNSASSSLPSGAVTPPRPAVRNIFEDPAPTGGLFSMFDDSPSEPAATSTSLASEPQPAQNEPASGGLFSIFSDTPQAAEPIPSEPSVTAVAPSRYGLPTVAQLLSGQASLPEDDAEQEGETSVKDLLDDDRIVPY